MTFLPIVAIVIGVLGLTYILLGLFGYDIQEKDAVKKAVSFEAQEHANHVDQLEQAYAKDIIDLQRRNDQLSYQIGIKDDIIKQLSRKNNEFLELTENYFQPLVDDLRATGGLNRFKYKRNVRDYIFERISNYIKNVRNIK